MDYVSTLLDLTRESDPTNPPTQTASCVNTPTVRAGVITSHRLISQQILASEQQNNVQIHNAHNPPESK